MARRWVLLHVPGTPPPATACLSIGEGPAANHRIRAVLGVAYPVVDEPEALARCHVESLGIVGHGRTLPAVTLTLIGTYTTGHPLR